MRKHYKVIYSICCSLFAANSVHAVEVCGNFAQGELIQAKAENSAHIFLNDKELPVLEDGTFLFAFARDAQLQQTLQIDIDGKLTNYTIPVAPTAWDIQKINGVPPRKVTPTDLDNRKIDKEREDLHTALSYQIKTPYWQKGFVMPVNKGRTSGNFGGQRIMNGKPKSPHQGMDIAAPEGSPVYAASDGVVTLSDGEYFYTGNVVVIAHGQNLSTIYAHLKNRTVQKGDKVKQGDIIGHVGKTGRATGPHLHWGASINGIRFQPLSLLKIGDKNFCKNL
ncbi:MAG: M23 family metallopeptidase [Alphaproteobacteria bacterium]|nr:M23 family metallopeptidase [Alphaproteobacteria bacterium]MBQ8678032.1 M23 family metallopeptidase [Alphaproteobacteria bacterium]